MSYMEIRTGHSIAPRPAVKPLTHDGRDLQRRRARMLAGADARCIPSPGPLRRRRPPPSGAPRPPRPPPRPPPKRAGPGCWPGPTPDASYPQGYSDGVALYLLGHNAFRLREVGSVSVPRLVVTVLCCALIPVAVSIPSLITLAILARLLCALAASRPTRSSVGGA